MLKDWYWCGHVKGCNATTGTLYAVPGGLIDRCDGCGLETWVYSGVRGWIWWLTGGFLMNRFWERYRGRQE